VIFGLTFCLVVIFEYGAIALVISQSTEGTIVLLTVLTFSEHYLSFWLLLFYGAMCTSTLHGVLHARVGECAAFHPLCRLSAVFL
jgi:hypothetical protein